MIARRRFLSLSAFAAFLGWLLLAPACISPSTPSEVADKPKFGKVTQDIINGKVDNAFPAVGSLTGGRRSFCTGTLIAPRVVVTAAHCVEAFAQVGGGAIEFRIDIPIDGGQYAPLYVPIDQANSKMHPNYSAQTVENDIAVVILQTPVFSIPPVPFNTQLVDQTWVGRELLFMGYGRLSSSDAEPAPRKYSTLMKINGVNPPGQGGQPKINTIGYAGQNTSVCQGDSGGPALFEINGKMTLIAVTSHGTSISCEGTSYSYRTDPYVSFIQGFLDQFSTCGATAPTCGDCGSCDGKICQPKPLAADPSVCKVCKTDADCGTGVCVDTGVGFRCTQTCGASDCCPPDFFCSGVRTGKKACLPAAAVCPPVACQNDAACGPGESCKAGTCAIKLPEKEASLCQACAKSSECGATGFCQTPDGRGGRCLQACDSRGLCPDGYVCKEFQPGLKQCAPKDGVCRFACQTDASCKPGQACKNNVCQTPDGGGPGEPCATDLPCKLTLRCLAATEGARCYQGCGFSEGTAGSPCRANNTCDAGLFCFQNPIGAGNFCLEGCVSGQACKTGGSCFPIPGGPQGTGLCVCQGDAQCTAGGGQGKCNVIFQGIGACTSGQSTACPQGETCSSSPGQPSVCVAGNGSRGIGQNCDTVNRCQSGLVCIPIINVCVESCTQSNQCTKGGTCQTLPIGTDKYCLCGQNSPCPNGNLCRVVAQGIGYCSPDSAAGCEVTGCPDGFICKDKACAPDNKDREVKLEPTPEPTPETPADTTSETATETPADTTAEAPGDGGTTDKGNANPDGQATDTKPTPSSCGCNQSPASPDFTWFFFVAFVAFLSLRRR